MLRRFIFRLNIPCILYFLSAANRCNAHELHFYANVIFKLVVVKVWVKCLLLWSQVCSNTCTVWVVHGKGSRKLRGCLHSAISARHNVDDI